MATKPTALVLLSGGLDSTTTLHIASSRGLEPLALIFRYGQRHAVEVERAGQIAAALGVAYRVQELDLRSIGGSALTDATIEVPRHRDPSLVAAGPIPPTYVPARNTIFLAYALAWAEVLDVTDIFVGVNALDYSGYPDCRPEYLEAFEKLANLASRQTTEGGARLRIHAPLLDKSKAEIVRWASELGVDLARTWSCYEPQWRGDEPLACGACDSCLLRRRGFEEAGIADPTPYAAGSVP